MHSIRDRTQSRIRATEAQEGFLLWARTVGFETVRSVVGFPDHSFVRGSVLSVGAPSPLVWCLCVSMNIFVLGIEWLTKGSFTRAPLTK